MTDAEQYMRSELARYDTLLTRIHGFIHGRTDDVSVGIGRIIQPIEVCDVCSRENDYSQGKWCKCWSPVTEADLAELRDMGVEVEDPDVDKS